MLPGVPPEGMRDDLRDHTDRVGKTGDEAKFLEVGGIGLVVAFRWFPHGSPRNGSKSASGSGCTCIERSSVFASACPIRLWSRIIGSPFPAARWQMYDE